MSKLMSLLILATAACGSSGSSQNSPNVTCDIIKNCDPAGLSVEARLCPTRIAQPACSASYKTYLQCMYADCSVFNTPDASLGGSPCATQYLACRQASLLLDGG